MINLGNNFERNIEKITEIAEKNHKIISGEIIKDMPFGICERIQRKIPEGTLVENPETIYNEITGEIPEEIT